MNDTILEEQWKKYQNDNSGKIIEVDTVDISTIRYIGGLDISFDKIDPTKGCAFLSIYDLDSDKIVYEDHILCNLTIPYISGFLGFREIPEYMKLLNKCKTSNSIYPDVIMIDGFGILHHRCFGSASHIGFDANIPSIGVAKTLLCVDGLEEKTVKADFKASCKNTGDYIKLIGTSGKTYGVAIKSAPLVENPIFVSIGHKISLESAIKLVTLTCKFRVPEPIRNSDIKSKLFF